MIINILASVPENEERTMLHFEQPTGGQIFAFDKPLLF